MAVRFRRLALFAACGLLPLLARADPGSALAFAALMLLVLALVAWTTSALAIWSLAQPARTGLYRTLLAFFVLSGLLGLLSRQFHGDWPLTGRLDPLWSLAIPLGSWRIGLQVARQRGATALGGLALGTAYFALYFLLQLALELVLKSAGLRFFNLGLLFGINYLWHFTVAIATWLLLAWQLPLAQPAPAATTWWRLPTLVAAAVLILHAGDWLLYQVLESSYSFLIPPQGYQLVQAVGDAAVSWLVGAAVLRWRRPHQVYS